MALCSPARVPRAMARTKLAPDVAAERARALSGWSIVGSTLRKEWKFDDYAHAMLFATAVAHLAEQHDHHPEMTVGYGYVRIELSTHDAGGLTEHDFALAAAIDAIPLRWYVKA